MRLNTNKFLVLAILSTMLVTLNACKKSFTGIKSVEIENKVTLAFENELTIVKSKQVDYNIRIHTNPDNSLLYYAINNEGAIKLKDYWIKVDSNVKFLNFYTSSNKPTSENYRLNFSDGEDELGETNVIIYPNPTSDLLNIKILGRNRGDIKIEVLSVRGELVITEKFFKGTDELEVSVSLGEFEKGVYFCKISYGGATNVYRILKS
jgi:hypothetical protein